MTESQVVDVLQVPGWILTPTWRSTCLARTLSLKRFWS